MKYLTMRIATGRPVIVLRPERPCIKSDRVPGVVGYRVRVSTEVQRGLSRVRSRAVHRNAMQAA